MQIERTENNRIFYILENGDWNASEIAVIKWQYNLFGSFYTALFEAIGHADPVNLKKLEIAFPDEVAGFRAWRDDPESKLANKIDEAIGL